MNRKELYEAVWKAPMRQVAETLGISDRTLRVACQDAGIPTPDRSYWSKMKVGKAPAIPKLVGDLALPVHLKKRDAIGERVVSVECGEAPRSAGVTSAATAAGGARASAAVDWLRLEAACEQWCREARLAAFLVHMRAVTGELPPEKAAQANALINRLLRQLGERDIARTFLADLV